MIPARVRIFTAAVLDRCVPLSFTDWQIFRKGVVCLDDFEQILTEEDRIKLNRKYKSAIKRVLKDVDQQMMKLNDVLIESAAVYATEIYECKLIMQRDGILTRYQNGENQFGYKESVAVKNFPKLTAQYQSIIRQLSKLLPSDNEKDAAAELMDFLNNQDELG